MHKQFIWILSIALLFCSLYSADQASGSGTRHETLVSPYTSFSRMLPHNSSIQHSSSYEDLTHTVASDSAHIQNQDVFALERVRTYGRGFCAALGTTLALGLVTILSNEFDGNSSNRAVLYPLIISAPAGLTLFYGAAYLKNRRAVHKRQVVSNELTDSEA